MPRALTEHEISVKEQFILDKAFKLFEDNSFKSFRMSDLAHSAKMSKGILFKYFKSKEILFLRLLELEHKKAFNMIDEKIKHHNEMSKEEFKEFIFEIFVEILNPKLMYLRLLKIKSVILEEKQDYDTVLRFNQRVHDLMYEATQNILLKVSGISVLDLRKLFAFQLILITGYLNSYNKEGVVKNVIEDAKMLMFLEDYKEVTTNAFRGFLNNF